MLEAEALVDQAPGDRNRPAAKIKIIGQDATELGIDLRGIKV
jgi:hypothetical protein